MSIHAQRAKTAQVRKHHAPCPLAWHGPMTNELAEYRGTAFHIWRVNRLVWRLRVTGPNGVPRDADFPVHPKARQAALDAASCL